MSAVQETQDSQAFANSYHRISSTVESKHPAYFNNETKFSVYKQTVLAIDFLNLKKKI